VCVCVCVCVCECVRVCVFVLNAAQQVLVMSSMWGLMKKNLMDAQEAILHTDPAFQSVRASLLPPSRYPYP
jgi:hypothetical protein